MSTRVHGEPIPHYTLDNPVRMPYQKYRLSIEDPSSICARSGCTGN